MRYLSAFIGGLVAAALLLVFQQHLIDADHASQPRATPVIKLAQVPTSLPPEQKPYEPREAPPKPEPLDTPVTRISSPAMPPVVPVRLEIPEVRIDGGNGPAIGFDVPTAMDQGAVVTAAVAPVYPVAALRNNVEGEVELEFTVRPDGSVTDVRVVRANPRGVFEQNAVRAIMRWQFVPKQEDGHAVPMRARQVIRFALPGEPL